MNYEQKRAKEILSDIPSNKIIIDFHTTTAKSPPFAIVVDPDMIPLAQTTGLRHIVYMKHNIKAGHSLIDHRHGISIETGQHRSPKVFNNIVKIIDNLSNKKRFSTNIYTVFEVISKPGNYKNFKNYQNKFIPILSGENAYDHFGLKAKLDTNLMLKFNHNL